MFGLIIENILEMKKLFFCVITFISAVSYAQLPPGQYSSSNKKAISLFEEAVKYYQERNDDKAKEEALKAIEKDANFIEPHLLIAELYDSKNKVKEAIDEYVKAISINPNFNMSNFYLLAELEIKIGKYDDAKKDYERFLKKPHINPDIKDIVDRQLDNCNFAIEAIKHPVPFDPKNMGEAINSELEEYFPAITADDQLFLYTRNNRNDKTDLQEDFYVSKKVNGVWGKSTPVSGINTPGNEGAPSFSADGELLFFAACQEMDGSYGPTRKGYGSCDIFYSQKVGDKWTKAYNIGPTINSKDWETQPSFSSDGKTLYFISNRKGGQGKSDIWYSTLNANGAWELPVNIGNKINTPEKEESVFIHPDGKTLYFSSNGHVGMGGLDIYVVRKDDNGNWGTPRNLGYPINTYADDNSLLVNGAGNLAYIGSSRAGGYGGLDMYQFELYDDIRPGKITYLKGKVYDAKTKAPLGAHFELIDLQSSKTIIISDANSGNGES